MEKRTAKPENDNKYYLKSGYGGFNPCILGNSKFRVCNGSVLPNCVGYATGRFNEIGGKGNCKWLGNRYAKKFIELAKKQGLEISDKPTLGGCMVWTNSGDGHVAIVEEVNQNYIVTSESAYNKDKAVYTKVRRNANGDWDGGNDDFIGCIVNPYVNDEEVVEKKNDAFKVGEVVRFIGKKHFTNSGQAEEKGKNVVGNGRCKVLRVYRLGVAIHPYRVQYIDRNECRVNGWVSAEDLERI